MDPRAYTLQCLSAALDFDFMEDNTSNENLWLAALHLSSVLCILIIPIVIWSWQKNKSYKIDKQGRVVLNFQITVTLMLFAALFLLMVLPAALILIGASGVAMLEKSPFFLLLTLCAPAPLILIGIFTTYQGVVNAVRALSDKPVHYPLTIPFVK